MNIKEKIYRFIIPVKERVQASVFKKYYKNSNDPEIVEILERINNTHKLEMFNYEFVDKYKKMNVNINYDREKHLYYIIHSNHIMYLKKSLNTRRKVYNYYISLFWDQDEKSPHRYLTSEFNLNEGDIVIDAGVAEGNFIIDNLHKVSKFIGVECDPEWIEALNYTFEKEILQEKVIIIPKMIGDEENSTCTTINEIYKKYNDISFVKMDIEGSEQKACRKAFEWIEHSKRDIKMAICTYHTPEAYEELVDILSEKCEIETTKGYMILNSIFGKPHGYFKPPFVRRGVIRVKRKSEQCNFN